MSENNPKTKSIGPPITEKRPFKKSKILSLLTPFISKIKTADNFNFRSVRYFNKGLLFRKIWHIRVNYFWNYGPSNLLFRFFHCRLGHLNNRQIKIAENLTMHFFEGKHQNKCLVKVSSSSTHQPQNDGPLNFFVKLNGNHFLMANFSKQVSDIWSHWIA